MPILSAFKKFLSFLRTLLIIGLITVVLGELVTRWVLDIHPLTTESIVWVQHPRWGWAHEPGAEGLFVKLGIQQQIHINSQGLREREIPYDRPTDELDQKRILVIGDSMVVGFEVPPEKVYTRVAEDVLRTAGYNVKIINGGCRGYGTDQSYLFLIDEGLKYKPDLVLYHWVGNDLDDNRTIHRPHRMFGKAAFHRRDDGALKLVGAPVPEYPYSIHLVIDENGGIVELPVSFGSRLNLWLRDKVITHSSLATTLVAVMVQFKSLSKTIMSAGRFQAPPTHDTDDSWLYKTTVAIVGAMREAANSSGARFRFIGTNAEQPLRIAADAGVEVLGEYQQFTELMEKAEKPTRVPFDGHLNELGHALYGKAVAAAIMGQNLLGNPQ